MQLTNLSELRTQLRGALQDQTQPLWFPDLSAALIKAEWDRLAREPGLVPSSYGTVRMLRRDPAAVRQIVGKVKVSVGTSQNQCYIPVEVLPATIADDCAGPDLRFYEAGELERNSLCERVEPAIRLLSSTPGLVATISSLIRALHIIDAQDDEVDISFSNPDLPFSAFLSVPSSAAKQSELRIGEALVHEAMHLQLTLIENVLLLIKPTGETFYSPWKREYRAPGGVVHALYVFRAIDSVMESLLDVPGLLSEDSRRYAILRRDTIRDEVGQVADPRIRRALTEEGKTLLRRLVE